MGILYLRFLIGALNVIFVVIVACVTLALALTISFKSLRDNADTAVSRLGAATGKRVDDFFATPQRQMDDVATANLRFDGFGGLPSESPTFGNNGSTTSGGGEVLQYYRSLMSGTMAEVQYRYLSFFSLFVDGSYLWQAPTYSDLLKRSIGVTVTTWKTGPFPTQQHPLVYSGHVLPSGAQHPQVTALFGALLPAFGLITDLRIPQYRAVIDGLYAMGTKSGTSLVSWGSMMFVAVEGLQYFFVPLTRPIVNATGFTLGYTQLMLRTNDVSAILSEGQLTPSTRLVIYDSDGYLFGASSGVTVFESRNFTGPDNSPGCATTNASSGLFPSDVQKRACRFHLRDTPVPMVQAAARKDEAFFTQGTTKGSVRLVGSQYVYVQKLPTLQGTRAFTIAMVVPEEDMIGDAKKILPMCAGVTSGVVLLVAVVSLVLVWLVLRPLQGIAERMGKAARLEADDETVDVSSLVEIGDLQRAFIEMRDELSRIRAFVPQSLLHANDQDTDEEEEEEEELSPGKSELSSGELHTVGADSQLDSMGSAATPESGLPIRPLRARSNGSIASRASRAYAPSRRGSGGSVFSRAVHGQRRPKAKLQLGAGIRHENVSVLSLNLRGFHAAVKDGLGIERMATTVEAVLRIAQQEKGVVDSFHGDRFLISFNAVKPAASHGTRAAIVAARVAEALSEGAGNSRTPGEHGHQTYVLPVTAGVASGTAQVGNLGSSEMKRFSIVGPVVSQAVCLERLCKLHSGASCLVPQRLFGDLRTAVLLKAMDYVRVPFAERPMLVGAVVRELSQASDDEWMYQLQQAGGGGVDGAGADDDFSPDGAAHVAQNNDVWEALTDGRLEDVEALFDVLQSKSNGRAASTLRKAVAAAAEARPGKGSPGESSFESPLEDMLVPRFQLRAAPLVPPRDLGDFYNEAVLGLDAVTSV